MENYKYINNHTGELYRDIKHAIKTVIYDMIHSPKCRTIKILNITKA